MFYPCSRQNVHVFWVVMAALALVYEHEQQAVGYIRT